MMLLYGNMVGYHVVVYLSGWSDAFMFGLQVVFLTVAANCLIAAAELRLLSRRSTK